MADLPPSHTAGDLPRRRLPWLLGSAVAGLVVVGTGGWLGVAVVSYLRQPPEQRAADTDDLSILLAAGALLVALATLVVAVLQLRQAARRRFGPAPVRQDIIASAPGATAQGAVGGSVVNHPARDRSGAADRSRPASGDPS